MDYELVFFSEMSLIEWAEYIYDLLNRKMKIEVKYKKYSEYISIVCKYLSFIIETDEIVGMDVIKEVFSFEGNISIRLQIFGKMFDQGIRILFMMLALILDDNSENFMLLENGSEIILKRDKDIIYTYVQEGYETDFPYKLLGKSVIHLDRNS